MSEPFLGQIALFPYSFPPQTWADCQGQLLPIAQTTALFSLLGVNFGGNGTSNFALPDLRGRVAVGQGSLVGGSDYVIGEEGGGESETLLLSSMPAHGHALTAQTAEGSTNEAAGGELATVAKGTLHGAAKGNIYNPGTPDTALVPASLSLAGGNQPHNNIQPSLTLRYCISMSGIFPQRG